MKFYCFVINAYELSLVMTYFRGPLEKLILFTPTVKQGYVATMCVISVDQEEFQSPKKILSSTRCDLKK